MILRALRDAMSGSAAVSVQNIIAKSSARNHRTVFRRRTAICRFMTISSLLRSETVRKAAGFALTINSFTLCIYII
jgi:hypothetical protein